MAPEIKFIFDRKPAVYKPGERVEGKVIIINEIETKLREIQIRYRGKSHNKWYNVYYRTYETKEEYYMDRETTLWPIGGSKSEDGDVLPAGQHEFKFDFTLSAISPSSFEGDIGWVRYTIFVKCRAYHGLDIDGQAAFTVLGDLDLNTDEQASILPTCDLEQKLGITKKSVKISAKLDKGGYVPGEQVVVTIDSEGQKILEKVKYSLVQTTRYEGHSIGTNYDKRNHSVVSMKENVHPPQAHHWVGSFVIPSVPPSDLPHCSIIVIKYKLKIKATFGGSKVNLEFPVRIGTIPLSSGALKFDQPPTYTASVFGAVDIEEKEDFPLSSQNTYAPLYPVFNLSES